mmetsp:Transcript_10896/g.21209  ORF Transcript_10896/g.21209 Transcript_10896/m.21209 type:complete len:243 (+) Transcript_10896:138-866(+)
MTIVATQDTRNSEWANAPNSYGRKMLEKMGWKGDGAGLGKNQQGTSTHLRAVRRADSLGIGAETDAFGDKGWQESSRGYQSVLASLQQEYSNGNGSDDSDAKKKRKKEEKKRKKKEEKKRKIGESGVVRLARNKVQAGHARKWREAKDLSNKSSEDMAAIFGVKADFYKHPQLEAIGTVSDSSDGAGEKKDKKKKKEKKKAKEFTAEESAKSEERIGKKRKRREDCGKDDEKRMKKEKKSKK